MGLHSDVIVGIAQFHPNSARPFVNETQNSNCSNVPSGGSVQRNHGTFYLELFDRAGFAENSSCFINQRDFVRLEQNPMLTSVPFWPSSRPRKTYFDTPGRVYTSGNTHNSIAKIGADTLIDCLTKGIHRSGSGGFDRGRVHMIKAAHQRFRHTSLIGLLDIMSNFIQSWGNPRHYGNDVTAPLRLAHSNPPEVVESLIKFSRRIEGAMFDCRASR